jgi:coatomer subunit beta
MVQGLACAVAKAYCDLIARKPTPPLQIENVLIVLDRLRQLVSVIMGCSCVDEVAMSVLHALAFCDTYVRQKVLNFAVDLLTPWNIQNMVQLLHNEMCAASTTIEYRAMLEEAIHKCHNKYLDV